MELQIEKDYDIQSVTNSILKLSLKNISLNEFLEHTLGLIISIPYFTLESKGCIFIAEEKKGILSMKAQKGLLPLLKDTCSEMQFGKCLCGQAASAKKIIFSNKIDDNHTIHYEGMAPHGHYCVPILFSGETLGVINLYVKEGYQYNEKDVTYLNAIADIIAGVIERKRKEDKITQQAFELSRSNKDLEQFAYTVSHDLKEPLRMVTSFTKLLEKRCKGKFDQDVDEFIGYIIEGSDRMNQLIDNLLEYSRLKISEKSLKPVSFKAALYKAIVNLNIAIKETGANITHDSLPVLKADEGQIAELFQNLIGNAIKFCGKEPPRIHISAKQENDLWLFSISDNGIGIDPQQKERIFEIFQRLHSRNEYPGTGIGLTICKKIVENHGGKIWVESEKGKGSIFYFTIGANEKP